MDALRWLAEWGFESQKKKFYKLTEKDPEVAHELLVAGSNMIDSIGYFGLSRLLLNHSDLKRPGLIPISNAAGLNKDGSIPSKFLQYLGFDRNVVGTVTRNVWDGNERPRVVRFPKTETIVNWMGLPQGELGQVYKEIERNNHLPTTLNVGLDANKAYHFDQKISSLAYMVNFMTDIKHINRVEINLSCPNTPTKEGGLDARSEYQAQASTIIETVKANLNQTHPHKAGMKLYAKISPDLDSTDLEALLEVIQSTGIHGIVTTNTTTKHNPEFITEFQKQGGASGNAVYDPSLETQQKVAAYKAQHNLNWKIIACGGINSSQRRDERIKHGADEIQLYTPLIFKGPKLLRDLRA